MSDLVLDLRKKEVYGTPGSILTENRFPEEGLCGLDREGKCEQSEVLWWHLCCSGGEVPHVDSSPFPFTLRICLPLF